MLPLASKTMPKEIAASSDVKHFSCCSTPFPKIWKSSRVSPGNGAPYGSVTVTGTRTSVVSTRIEALGQADRGACVRGVTLTRGTSAFWIPIPLKETRAAAIEAKCTICHPLYSASHCRTLLRVCECHQDKFRIRRQKAEHFLSDECTL